MSSDIELPVHDNRIFSASRVSLGPANLVALLAISHGAAWTLVPALTRDALPIDTMGCYMWGREWVLATYKHPGLPNWFLEASHVLTGVAGWPAYLVSQLFAAATFAFVYLLGRDLMGAERAAAGTLLLAGAAFHGWHAVMFNHNVALMPFWAALPWALWRAVERRGTGWWALAGAVAAAGLYAKLQLVLLAVALAGWFLWDARARRALATPGPWVGLVSFLVLAAPLAIVIARDLGPLNYIADRAAPLPGGGMVPFLGNMVVAHIGTVVMLAVAGLLGRPRQAQTAGGGNGPPADRALRFLVVIVAVPPALAAFSALILGFKLRSPWAIPMFSGVGLLAIALLSSRFNRQALQRLAAAAVVMLVALPLAYAVTCRLPESGALKGAHWPQAEISARLSETWARETGRPLRIVTGEFWMAHVVGVVAKDKPSMFTGGSFALAPWITPQRIDKEGMLVVWQDDQLPASLQPLMASYPVGREVFRMPGSRHGDLVIRYMVVPPKSP